MESPEPLKNEQMTASSAHIHYPAHYGLRRHFSAWCADPIVLENPVSVKSQYLQIDFLGLMNITGIAIEGRDKTTFVKDFFVYYATDESAFHSLREKDRNEKMVSNL